jgi:hypothetical protein
LRRPRRAVSKALPVIGLITANLITIIIIRRKASYTRAPTR